MKNLNDYLIKDFINERVAYFTKILDRTKCYKIDKEFKEFLINIYKCTLSEYHLRNFTDEILLNNKPVQRVELVLIDKIIE